MQNHIVECRAIPQWLAIALNVTIQQKPGLFDVIALKNPGQALFKI